MPKNRKVMAIERAKVEKTFEDSIAFFLRLTYGEQVFRMWQKMVPFLAGTNGE